MRRLLLVGLAACGAEASVPPAAPKPVGPALVAVDAGAPVDAAAEQPRLKKEGRTLVAGVGRTWVVLASGRVASWGVADPDDLSKIDARPRLVDGRAGITGVGRDQVGEFYPRRATDVPCFLPETKGCGRPEEVPHPLAGVLGQGRVSGVSPHGESACVVTAAGEIRCAGPIANEHEPMTNRSDTDLTSRSFGVVDDVVELAVGDFHACALRRRGEVVCFGHVGVGLLGDGRTWDRPRAPVAGIGDAKAVALSPFGGCALRRSGRVACWGAPVRKSAPVDLDGVELADRFVADGTCVVRTDRKLQCFKEGVAWRVDVSDAKDAAWVRGKGLCVVRATGAVECHDPSGKRKPVPLPRATGAFAISSGEGVTAHVVCVLLTGGRLRCWASTDDSLPPYTWSVPKDAVEVRAIGLSTFGARMHDAGVVVRTASGARLQRIMTGIVMPIATPPATKPKPDEGMTARGSLDPIDGEPETRVEADGRVVVDGGAVDGITDAVSVTSSDETTCVVHKTGALSCWGRELGASLGRGVSAYAPAPVRVALPEPPLL